MGNKIKLQEEIEEEQAFSNVARKNAEEKVLELDLSKAKSENNLEQINKIEKELETVTRQRIELYEVYLRSKLKSAIACKRIFVMENGNALSSVELEKVIPTFFDKDILEAENEMRLHLEKYDKADG